MTDVKGTALVATVRYIEETFGTPALSCILAKLTPEERARADGLLASAWYPFPLLVRLMQLTREQHRGQVPDVIRRIGRASADYGLKGIYRIFYKVGTPSFVISKASAVMKTYYTSGEMKAVVSESKHAAVELTGFADPAPELCERLDGWMERTLELSGGKDVRIVHERCVNRGDAVCRWEAWWS